MASDDAPMPAWTRVTMRATFEEEMDRKRAPFGPLIVIETAVYAAVGIALAAVISWLIFV
jgi:fatty acid desaturase